jgi:hypothetical protein
MLKSEQLEKLANAYLKAARDKRISAAKRMEYRVEGGRWRKGSASWKTRNTGISYQTTVITEQAVHCRHQANFRSRGPILKRVPLPHRR